MLEELTAIFNIWTQKQDGADPLPLLTREGLRQLISEAAVDDEAIESLFTAYESDRKRGLSLEEFAAAMAECYIVEDYSEDTKVKLYFQNMGD